MNFLIQLNLLLLMRIKPWLVSTLLFILLAFSQLIILEQSINEKINSVNLWDYMILALGGVFIKDKLFELLGWVSTIIPILLYVSYLIGVSGGFELFVLTRVKSRGKWWTAKFFSTICLVLLYSTWYFIICFIIGVSFFPFEKNYSLFFKDSLFYFMATHFPPYVLIIYIWLLFVTGIIAFCTLTQTMAIIFKNSNVFYVTLIIIFFTLGEIYIQGYIPRELSPINYPSFLDLFQNNNQDFSTFSNAIVFNIFFSLVNFIISLVLISRYKYFTNIE